MADPPEAVSLNYPPPPEKLANSNIRRSSSALTVVKYVVKHEDERVDSADGPGSSIDFSQDDVRIGQRHVSVAGPTLYELIDGLDDLFATGDDDGVSIKGASSDETDFPVDNDSAPNSFIAICNDGPVGKAISIKNVFGAARIIYRSRPAKLAGSVIRQTCSTPFFQSVQVALNDGSSSPSPPSSNSNIFPDDIGSRQSHAPGWAIRLEQQEKNYNEVHAILQGLSDDTLPIDNVFSAVSFVYPPPPAKFADPAVRRTYSTPLLVEHKGPVDHASPVGNLSTVSLINPPPPAKLADTVIRRACSAPLLFNHEDLQAIWNENPSSSTYFSPDDIGVESRHVSVAMSRFDELSNNGERFFTNYNVGPNEREKTSSDADASVEAPVHNASTRASYAMERRIIAQAEEKKAKKKYDLGMSKRGYAILLILVIAAIVGGVLGGYYGRRSSASDEVAKKLLIDLFDTTTNISPTATTTSDLGGTATGSIKLATATGFIEIIGSPLDSQVDPGPAPASTATATAALPTATATIVPIVENGEFKTDYWYRLTNEYFGPSFALDIIPNGSNSPKQLYMNEVDRLSSQEWQIEPVPASASFSTSSIAFSSRARHSRHIGCHARGRYDGRYTRTRCQAGTTDDVGNGEQMYYIRNRLLGPNYRLVGSNIRIPNEKSFGYHPAMMMSDYEEVGQRWWITAWSDGTFALSNGANGMGFNLTSYSDSLEVALTEGEEDISAHWSFSRGGKITDVRWI